MAGAQIDKGSTVKIARNLGKNGKPMPAEIAADPALRAAYYEGAGTTDPDAPKAPEKHPQTNPANNSGGTASRKSAARPSATTSRRAGAATKRRKTIRSRAADLITHPSTLGTGSGGGMLLAVFAYPLLVSVLKYGKQGPNIWLKAKFLNQTVKTPNSNPYANLPGAATGAAGQNNMRPA